MLTKNTKYINLKLNELSVLSKSHYIKNKNSEHLVSKICSQISLLIQIQNTNFITSY